MANLMTVNEVADYLMMSPKWVYQHSKEIPGYFRVAGAIFFNRETLIKFTVGHVPTKPKESMSDNRHGI